MSVSEGKSISIEYTLKLDDDKVVDSNVGGNPLVYTHGTHQIIPGLEKAMEGMNVGETKQVTVRPDEGYGQVDRNAFIEVQKEQVPSQALDVGVALQVTGPEGKVFTARVDEIKDSSVVLDFNHPLAGQTLHFDVKVLKIQEAHLQ